MTVRLGINPITWTNDDMPELAGDIPLETCLAEARLAGFSGSRWEQVSARCVRARPLLDRHNMVARIAGLA